MCFDEKMSVPLEEVDNKFLSESSTELPKKAEKKKIQVSIQIGETECVYTYSVNPKMLTSQLCEKFSLKNPSLILSNKVLQLYLEDRILPNQFTLEYNLVYDKSVLKGEWIEKPIILSKKTYNKIKFSFILLYKGSSIPFEYECRPTTNISTMIKDICIYLGIEELKIKIHLVWNHHSSLSKKAQMKDYPFQQNDTFELIFSFPVVIHSDKYPETIVYVHPMNLIQDIVNTYQLYNKIECKDILFSKDGILLKNDKKLSEYEIHSNDVLKVYQIKIDPFSLLKKNGIKKPSFFASSVMFNAPEPSSLPLPPSDFL